jgi:hypothetical protein
MAKIIVIYASLGILGCILANGATSSTGPVSQPPVERLTAVGPSAPWAGSRFAPLEGRPAPVPFVRKVPLRPISGASAEVATAWGDLQPH